MVETNDAEIIKINTKKFFILMSMLYQDNFISRVLRYLAINHLKVGHNILLVFHCFGNILFPFQMILIFKYKTCKLLFFLFLKW